MKYVPIKTLETLPDGRQCVTYLGLDGEICELTAPAIMRMSVPDDGDVSTMTTLHLELIPATAVIDIPNPLDGVTA